MRCHEQNRALPEQTLARVIGNGDAAEPAAVDVRHAVMARQPFVDERVVAAEQVEGAALLAEDALEEQLRLALKRLAQVVVEVREFIGVGHDPSQIA